MGLPYALPAGQYADSSAAFLHICRKHESSRIWEEPVREGRAESEP